MFKIGLKTLLRRLPASAYVAVLCLLAAAWPTARLVHAASGPHSDPPADSGNPKTAATTPAPSTTTPTYGTASGITGPTTAFHDSVASHYNYAFGKDTPFLPSNATTVQRPVLQPQSLPHRPILRPLPPGGLSPVAPVRSLQQLPRPLVPEKRQRAHRRKGRAVFPPLRGLPQPRRPALRRPVAGHAQEAPL